MNKHNGSVLQNRSTRGMTGCRVLVSALAGREHVLNAYKIAVQEKYRFFSFGDAMLIK